MRFRTFRMWMSKRLRTNPDPEQDVVEWPPTPTATDISCHDEEEPSTHGAVAALDVQMDAPSTIANLKLSHAKKDTEYWFADGSIIVVAQDVAFCVYGGLLATHSTVFSDMLHIPQAQGTGQTPPIVSLSDSPADLRHLWRAIMPLKGPYICCRNESCDALRAWICLGDKYELSDLLDESLQRLRNLFPHSDDLILGHDWDTQLLKNPSFAIAAVNLARLTGATDILPLAIAGCCMLGPDVVRGYKQDDGTYEYLKQEDLQLCLRASDTLVTARLKLLTVVVGADGPLPGCTRAADAYELDKLHWHLLTKLPHWLLMPVVGSRISTIVTEVLPHLCDVCVQAIQEKELIQLKKTLSDLRALVGLTESSGPSKESPSAEDPPQ